MDVPVLETDRLVLRNHRIEDYDALARIWADPAVTRFIGTPSSREESWSRLIRYVGHWELLGFGAWAVERREVPGYIGFVGFADLRRDISPPFDGIPESGWVFQSQSHGSGYATEAMQAALAWMDRHHGGDITTCVIHSENAASIRVARKLGYTEHARSDFRGVQVIQFRRAKYSD